MSKSAIIFRGRQLGVFSDDQARIRYLWLNRHGKAVQEFEDHQIANDELEAIIGGLKVMKEHFGVPQSAGSGPGASAGMGAGNTRKNS